MASLVARLVKNLPAMQETLVQFLGWDDPVEKGQATHSKMFVLLWWLKWLRIRLHVGDLGFLGWDDPLRESMATHSNILTWRISMGRGAWWATVHGVTESQT